jgi:o-succinylbenzoate---CoA ligase
MDPTSLTSAAFWQDPEPVLFETSGSAGVPKQVVISKPSLHISAQAVNQHLGVTKYSRWGLALPLHHVGGFGVAARAYQAECGLSHFTKRWNARDFCIWATEEKITHTSMVPTQVHDLVQSGETAPTSLLAIVVGGGQLDIATGQAARDLGWPVLASYGMTETSSQIATQGLDQLALPYQPFPLPILPIWDCQVSDGQLLAISGPALFLGYRSGEVFTPRVSEWHTTSDRVILFGGMLQPLGRADLQVKVLGELVDPEGIEGQLIARSAGKLKHGSIVIIPIRDERRGHLLVPILEAASELPCLEELVKAHSASSPTFEKLEAPFYIKKFPLTELGKIRRTELARLLGLNPFRRWLDGSP